MEQYNNYIEFRRCYYDYLRGSGEGPTIRLTKAMDRVKLDGIFSVYN